MRAVSTSRPDGSLEVAVLAPTGRDGTVARQVLARAGLSPAAYADMPALCAAIARGVGAALLAEEALDLRGSALLFEQLDRQPSWSGLPVIVLTGEGELSQSIPRALTELTERADVTLLERPVRVATLVTTLRAALRARRRQYDVRDHLEERHQLLASERTLREQAEQAAERAADANRAKAEFLAMMSHELRTPLNAIAGYTQLLEMGVRGPVTDEQREDLARIDRSQRHLLSVINDLLNFAKLEAGRVQFALSPVVMHDVLLEVEALVGPQLRAKSLRYVDEGNCRDLMALADPEKAKQILINLLSNAIKFTPAGGTIGVECAAGNGLVRTIVRDDGTGIPADKLEAVFEPFVQVDREFASRQEGTGLGLAISRDLARGMGGDLTATSALGTGSAFTLTLPQAPAVVPA